VYGSQFVDVLYAVERPDAAFRTNAVFTVANLSLNVILVSQFGWTGAAVATLLSSALTLLLGYYYLSKLLETIQIPIDELARQVASAVMMTVVVYVIEIFIGPSHIGTILVVFVGAIAYVIVLVTISANVRHDVKNFFGNVSISI
jgi:O-antigen/teichoic acid export membrane protein